MNKENSSPKVVDFTQDSPLRRLMRDVDPDYDENLAASMKEEASLLEDLSKVGVIATSVWYLVNTSERYPAAIPVLIDHLNGDHDERTKEGIARALIVPEARGVATPALVRAFTAVEDGNSLYKWALGLALGATASRQTAHMLVDLARNPAHGRARKMIPSGLTKLPRDEAIKVLNELLNDPDTESDARTALKRMRKQKK